MNDKKISIILSTYDREQYIGRAIENILNQTFKDFEFIIINNGSSDNTRQICEKYQKSDSRIRLLNIQKNVGISKARELGVGTAKGEYIAFIDDDDICEKEMIEFLYNLAIDNQADISICGSVSDYGDRIEPYFVYDDILVLDKVKGLDEFLKREKFNTAPPTKLFKKKLFQNIHFLNNVRIDDIHFMYKVFAAAEKTVAHGKPLYRFVKHNGNITGFIQTNKLDSQLLDEYLMMQKHRVEYLSEKVPEISSRARYSAWSFMISMCDKIKTFNSENCSKQYEYMIKILRDNLTEINISPFLTDRERLLLKKYVI